MVIKNQKKESKAQKNGNTELKSSEACLWILLHNKKLKGNKFCRHYRMGEFFVDFYCPGAKLAIVIDAGESSADHHRESSTGHHLESCCERDNYLESEGINVLHVESKKILENSKLVLDRIITELSATAICESLKMKVDSLEALSLN